ncbi:topoisomerase [Streptomyces spectabilis]|uniref:topoisomerase n=1 Tax=Streptomyces spectabilis TaxID=68270 RepID=UPI0033ED3A22
MPKLHDSQKADLVAAAKLYMSNYKDSPAEQYMAQRGLGGLPKRFGYVSEPAVGHERHRGYLAIPYWRPAGGIHSVATMRFRCIADSCVKAPDGAYLPPHKERHAGHGKYMGLPGHSIRLYNTPDLLGELPYVAVTEGELDCAAMHGAGIPSVGVPGAAGWRDHFVPALCGFTVVFALGDGDDAGRRFATKVCEELPNAKPIDLGDGYDAARFIHDFGPDAVRERLGL